MQGANCDGRRSRREEAATAKYETLIVMTDKKDEAKHIRNVYKMQNMPGERLCCAHQAMYADPECRGGAVPFDVACDSR